MPFGSNVLLIAVTRIECLRPEGNVHKVFLHPSNAVLSTDRSSEFCAQLEEFSYALIQSFLPGFLTQLTLQNIHMQIAIARMSVTNGSEPIASSDLLDTAQKIRELGLGTTVSSSLYTEWALTASPLFFSIATKLPGL